MEAQTAEAELKTMFGSMFPGILKSEEATDMETEANGAWEEQRETSDRATKWRRNEGKGTDGKGQSSDPPEANSSLPDSRPEGRRSKGDSRGRRSHGNRNQDTHHLQEVIELMSKVALRQEDQLAQLRVDNGYVFTVLTNEDLVPKLFAASQRWHTLKTQGRLDSSLRNTLLMLVFMEMEGRLSSIMDNAEVTARMLAAGWIVEDPAGGGKLWTYQTWDPDSKSLKVDASRTPMPHGQLMETLARLKPFLASSSTILKFCATRPIQEKMQGATLTLILSVALRQESAPVSYTHLRAHET